MDPEMEIWFLGINKLHLIDEKIIHPYFRCGGGAGVFAKHWKFTQVRPACVGTGGGGGALSAQRRRRTALVAARRYASCYLPILGASREVFY
ncbi:hypothetical protein EVAR_68392_1 [Eumeta japonica]|uniref:Uncharacterized protein n=1 Tax=Eumeta variegata TaxID=151549 RepID=A0A4C2A873_EUMVA|nr:hypothetical protein EVAR_68392_1 [Eumeta japonica]